MSDATKTAPTFRLYQSIRFNRPLVRGKDEKADYVSPGGYELKMRAEDGTEKTIRFDFEDFEGGVDSDNPCMVNCMQKNPDYNTFPDISELTEYMFRNIIEVTEWFIYTGEHDDPANKETPLIPVEILNAEIELFTDDTRGTVSIPINVPIKPSCHFKETAADK